MNSRFDQGLRRLLCPLAAGLMTFGLIVGPAHAATEVAKLTASDGAADDNFGVSVSVSGDVAVVGAKFDDHAGFRSGSAYVYRFDPITSVWVQEAKLTASNAGVGHQFGRSVSVSGDIVVIGAWHADGLVTVGSGSAYVFVKPLGGWVDMTETAKLTASDGVFRDGFGTSVSVSAHVVVGAPRDDDAGSASGSAYVFVKPPGGWVDMTESAKLTASDGAAGDNLGTSVSVSGDVAVVGAQFGQGSAPDSGAAYVYRFDLETPGWIEEAKLTAGDVAFLKRFGESVSVSGDVAVVGAPGSDAPGVSFSGAAYVFRFNSDTSGWTQEAKLTASDAAAIDEFGSTVSVTADVVVVGASGDDDAGSASGSAYVFVKPPAGWMDMTETEKLNASDAAAGDSFGTSVSVTGDVAVVGSKVESAYVFDLPADAIDLTLALIVAVVDLNLQQGISNGLDAKLDAVLRALSDLNQHNNGAALNVLNAFVTHVENQSGNQIPQGDADALIADALEIIALLSS